MKIDYTIISSKEMNYIVSISASDSRKRKGGFLAVFFLCAFLLSFCNQLVIMLYTILLPVCYQSVIVLFPKCNIE